MTCNTCTFSSDGPQTKRLKQKSNLTNRRSSIILFGREISIKKIRWSFANSYEELIKIALILLSQLYCYIKFTTFRACKCVEYTLFCYSREHREGGLLLILRKTNKPATWDYKSKKMGNRVPKMKNLAGCTCAKEPEKVYSVGKPIPKKKVTGDGSIECEVHIFNHVTSLPEIPATTITPVNSTSWYNNTLPLHSSHYQNHKLIKSESTDNNSANCAPISFYQQTRFSGSCKEMATYDTVAPDDDPSRSNDLETDIFCAKYDYNPSTRSDMSCIDGEPLLYFKRNDYLMGLGYHSTKLWLKTINCKGQIGWAPANHLLPIKPTAEPLNWYHGMLTKSNAEFILSKGVNGSFLVRDSESSPDKMTISVHFDGKVYHYHILTDQVGKFHINMEKAFNSISDVVQYHTMNSDGLITNLIFPINPTRLLEIENELQCSIYSAKMITSQIAMSVTNHGSEHGNTTPPPFSMGPPFLEFGPEFDFSSEQFSTSTENSSCEHRYYENTAEVLIPPVPLSPPLTKPLPNSTSQQIIYPNHQAVRIATL